MVSTEYSTRPSPGFSSRRGRRAPLPPPLATVLYSTYQYTCVIASTVAFRCL